MHIICSPPERPRSCALPSALVDMLTDFPEKADKPVMEDLPFSLRVIVEWYRYDYHSRLRETLETLLLAETRLKPETRLDLARANLTQLTAYGVSETAVSLSGACTSHQAENWFSYRREGSDTGRMVAAVRLRPSNTRRPGL